MEDEKGILLNSGAVPAAVSLFICLSGAIVRLPADEKASKTRQARRPARDYNDSKLSGQKLKMNGPTVFLRKFL